MTPVEQELLGLIQHEGPIGVDRFMAMCLGHYYGTRVPFGLCGDFITAPEISQIFGELIGLWAAQTWHMMGEPAQLRLIELGPGRGTLMADVLRAARIVPGFNAAIEVHLVETSPVLRVIQAQALRECGHAASWHDNLATALKGPVIVIGNEFLDALPLRQFQRKHAHWHERVVGLNETGRLCFTLDDEAHPATAFDASAPDGTVVERAEMAISFVAQIAGHVAAHGGAALFIDYGAAISGMGDTLQAVRQHQFVDVFAQAGEADLTVQVDFAALAHAARQAGASVAGPVTQAHFLDALGLHQRAAKLLQKASVEQATALKSAVARLTESSATGMGELFKAMAIIHPKLRGLPGF